MQSISSFFKQNDKLLFGLSASCLLGYVLFRDQIWNCRSEGKCENLLDTSLEKLMANKSHAKIKKIVITTSISSRGDFRKNLINFLKSRLIQEGIKVLINCSPQKLLKAGCECFLQSMEPDDSDYLKYYYNALKTQYLIEDTIANIQLINEGNDNQIIMICDNNPFDIKLMNANDDLWTQFLDKHNIKEEEILSGYDLVIHVIDQDSVKTQDERIKQAWSRIPQYHQILVGECDTRENFDKAFSKIVEYLALAKEAPILAS